MLYVGGFVRSQVTAERVKAHFEGLVFGEVERFEWDAIEALNFVCHEALDGGAEPVDAFHTGVDSALSGMDIPSEHVDQIHTAGTEAFESTLQETGNVEKVMDGGLDDFIEAYLKWNPSKEG